MKTILVPTDFSKPAENAARYALQLARYLEADISLCHAFFVPTVTPMAAQVAWPLYDYSGLKQDTDNALESLVKKLGVKDGTNTVGQFTTVVTERVTQEKADMVVMGMSGAGALSKFFLGSNSQKMIDAASFPVLLVPAEFAFSGIKKIAFATDLSSGDIKVIHSLAGFARRFNADLLVTHITDHSENTEKSDAFLNEITCKINYDKIYYRQVKNADIDEGLDWLSDHGFIDMLVMVHHHRNFLDRLFTGSHTQRQIRHIHVPLFVFPVDVHPVF